MADPTRHRRQSIVESLHSTIDSDREDRLALEKQGYKVGHIGRSSSPQQEFLREFGNIATFSFAFSVMGVSSSIAVTFGTPLLTGGPASVVWCWLMGSCFSFFIGTSVAELVSAYPTSGAL